MGTHHPGTATREPLTLRQRKKKKRKTRWQDVSTLAQFHVLPLHSSSSAPTCCLGRPCLLFFSSFTFVVCFPSFFVFFPISFSYSPFFPLPIPSSPLCPPLPSVLCVTSLSLSNPWTTLPTGLVIVSLLLQLHQSVFPPDRTPRQLAYNLPALRTHILHGADNTTLHLKPVFTSNPFNEPL